MTQVGFLQSSTWSGGRMLRLGQCGPVFRPNSIDDTLATVFAIAAGGTCLFRGAFAEVR